MTDGPPVALSPQSGDGHDEAPDLLIAIEGEEEDVITGLSRLELRAPDPSPESRKTDLQDPEKPVTFVPQPLAKETRKPTSLVDLPVDVLKDIVKEVTHTNDLTNLCLTCRCLHALAIPHIYSRFDIVWPDAATTGDRTGVDALTYGLSTLSAAGKRGNDYARWVKKFSLGNGPADWVNEYNITKEGGKMLGTLVTLAVGRMESLETFSWDMPTGVLRDVFMALHDLEDTIKNVHVRFHDNRETTTPTSQDISRRVESPTFKGFKNLRSLSVLDIDERQYLEEMSYAVANSVDRLKELRIGLALHMDTMHKWIRDWDDLEETNAGGDNQDGVLGGVLGIVVGRVVDLEVGRRRRRSNKHSSSSPEMANAAVETAEAVVMTSAAPAAVYVAANDIYGAAMGSAATTQPPSGTNTLPHVSVQTPTSSASNAATTSTENLVVPIENAEQAGLPETTTVVVDFASAEPSTVPSTSVASPEPAQSPTPKASPAVSRETPRPYEEEPKPPRQLKLDTLDLERVPISVWVLSKAIDWSVLSNLTILSCYNHERLWKALRRKFSPYQSTPSSGSLNSATGNMKHGSMPSHLHSSTYRTRGVHQPMLGPLDYKIRLKKLHTDCVTPHLIQFIRDTLPPNSLEVLFLQETTTPSTVTMDAIYKGALRRHKGSLKKLLIDSKNQEEGESYKWTFTKDHLAFVSSGKMPHLRELGMAIEYKDWHFFLTRLPHMPHLRSLYIIHTRDCPHITQYAPRELANQILNTVILRPEIELCYVGIWNKCFEVLEGTTDESEGPEAEIPPGGVHDPTHSSLLGQTAPPDDSEDEETDDELEGESDAGSEEDIESVVTLSDEEQEGPEAPKTRIRLREILFYDDKVAVFRARNARL